MGVTGQTKVSATNVRHLAQLWSDWLGPIVILVAASIALVSDGALFRESSQLVAVAVVLCLGLVLSAKRWSVVCAVARTRLGLLAIVNGVVLVISAMLSVYHWASVRELLKDAALVEAFLLGATLIDRQAVRDRFLLVFYWWSVTAVGAGSILFLVGMRWPQSWMGSYAVRMLATAADRLSAFFGYANAFAAFLLVPVALGVVSLAGRVANVSDYLCASDVLLSTSIREGLPRSFMEAMATGLPIVAYDTRGCNDLVVDGETGFLVPFGDVRGLADKLVWLAQHPDERCHMGETGRRRVQETFSLDAVLPQMRAVYQNELGRKGMQP